MILCEPQQIDAWYDELAFRFSGGPVPVIALTDAPDEIPRGDLCGRDLGPDGFVALHEERFQRTGNKIVS